MISPLIQSEYGSVKSTNSLNRQENIKNNSNLTFLDKTTIREAQASVMIKKMGANGQTNRYYENQKQLTFKCFRCQKTGHLVADCPSRNHRCCYLCGENHDARFCDQFYCMRCNRAGHESNDCHRRRKTVKFCLICHSKTHFFDECECKSPKQLKKVRCFICGNFGHLMCRKSEEIDPKAVLYCCNCGDFGHFDLDCNKEHIDPEIVMQGIHASKWDQCALCGARGHKTQFCPDDKSVRVLADKSGKSNTENFKPINARTPNINAPVFHPSKKSHYTERAQPAYLPAMYNAPLIQRAPHAQLLQLQQQYNISTPFISPQRQFYRQFDHRLGSIQKNSPLGFEPSRKRL